jgi:acrylyl-CoA reductase (NADPH)
VADYIAKQEIRMQRFKAFRIHNDDQGFRAGVEEIDLDQLLPGQVLIETRFSSVNYKDALAASPTGKVVRQFPINGGIDCAGTVLESSDYRFHPGDEVLATGYGLGVSHDGGYARYVRLPADWLVPMPAGMGPLHAMALGTAGFTAGLALRRMEQNGQTPERGPILITGASGGVGSIAVALLASNGYEVVAVSGKPERRTWLEELGATRVIDRDQLELSSRPLDKGLWGGIVDTVAGQGLAGLLPQLAPQANVALIGLVGGAHFQTSVMPFILRGASLLGIDSVNCPQDPRTAIWQRLATQLDRNLLDELISRVITLDELTSAFASVLDSRHHGRILVETGG